MIWLKGWGEGVNKGGKRKQRMVGWVDEIR